MRLTLSAFKADDDDSDESSEDSGEKWQKKTKKREKKHDRRKRQTVGSTVTIVGRVIALLFRGRQV